MTGWAAATLIGLGAAAVLEGIWLNGKMHRLIAYAEQLLNVGADKVAAQPSKSAARDEPSTEPIDAQPAPAPVATPVADDEWRTQFQFKQPGDAA